ncbi:hypothetical protein MSAN_00940600 [Mycena sanguinolenta]|uniref:Uncharacterized protein n=1 Tax=Mycena sanguinolenta TaxID=230812 RepID=A0A8H7DC96_9AGAR|nr:hypothetical protein MSAN_00940600 [Mycena sanguinolenta]
MNSHRPTDMPQELSQQEACVLLRERDERKRALARERMARRRATIKTFPLDMQEVFAQRAREARAKYREQNRYLLMYKAQCRRRKKKRVSEDVETHESSAEASVSPPTPMSTPLPNSIVQLFPSPPLASPSLHYNSINSPSIDHPHNTTHDIILSPGCRSPAFILTAKTTTFAQPSLRQ